MSALSARILNSLAHLKSFVLPLTPTSPLCSMPISYETTWDTLHCSCFCRSGPMSSAVFHFLSLMSIRLLILSLHKKSITLTSFKMFLILTTKIVIIRILSGLLLHMKSTLYGNYYFLRIPQYPVSSLVYYYFYFSISVY